VTRVNLRPVGAGHTTGPAGAEVSLTLRTA